MTSKKNKARFAKDSNRKFKKKANPLSADKIDFIDYKDVNLLQRFMSDRSKIRGQRLSGTTVQQQRELATAIKNAREMALLPYTKRSVSTRAPRPGADRRDDDGSRSADYLDTAERADDAAILSDDLGDETSDEITVDAAETGDETEGY